MTAGKNTIPRHMALGATGEDIAARFFANMGWRILERNWRPAGRLRGLELDIVAQTGETVIFAEVKTRSRTGNAARESGVPTSAAFTPEKQRRMLRAAQLYLTARNWWDRPCRFDLVCLEQWPDGSHTLEHHTHVIEIGHTVDSGNAAWQPW